MSKNIKLTKSVIILLNILQFKIITIQIILDIEKCFDFLEKPHKHLLQSNCNISLGKVEINIQITS